MKKGSLFIDTRKTLKTKDTFQCENLNMSLITEKAKLSGYINDGNLQIKASKDVILKSGFHSHVENSVIAAKSIEHETGSKHKVTEQNIEIAENHISIQKNANIEAKNNFFKTKDLFGYVRIQVMCSSMILIPLTPVFIWAHLVLLKQKMQLLMLIG